MDRTDLFYWALGAGGVAVAHYLANRQQGLGGAAAHAAASVAQQAMPRLQHPMMQACAEQVARYTRNTRQRLVQAPPPGAKPQEPSAPGPRIIDADFTILDDGEQV